MDKNTQTKIKKVVQQYRKLFPGEYQQVCELVKDQRRDLQHESGAVEGDHALERVLLTYPETLHNQIYNALSPDEYVQFNEKAGQRWFANTFPQFRVPETV